MTQHDPEGSEEEGGAVEARSTDEEGAEATDDSTRPGRSLPPPAFPPGARRRAVLKRSAHPGRSLGGKPDELPSDVFISPDDPIRKEGRGIPDDAFISPDDPLVPAQRDEEGHVTGLGVFTVPSSESGSARRQTPSIHELPYLLDQLAEQLHESGEKALEVSSEMGHFQAALRSFLKGYLRGNRD